MLEEVERIMQNQSLSRSDAERLAGKLVFYNTAV